MRDEHSGSSARQRCQRVSVRQPCSISVDRAHVRLFMFLWESSALSGCSSNTTQWDGHMGWEIIFALVPPGLPPSFKTLSLGALLSNTPSHYFSSPWGSYTSHWLSECHKTHASRVNKAASLFSDANSLLPLVLSRAHPVAHQLVGAAWGTPSPTRCEHHGRKVRPTALKQMH